MNFRILRWLVASLLMIFFINADEVPLKNLKYFADGLNIEGGSIPKKYLRKEQIWANLCVILDRPFEDGLEWQELTVMNTYPLKEATLLNYNEAQVNFAYVTILQYYLKHVRQIVNKSRDDTAKILIQVHRNTSGPLQVELLKNLLLSSCSFTGLEKERVHNTKFELYHYFFPDLNVELNFFYGAAAENLGELDKYQEFDLIFSFSLVAGLHSDWQSGSLLYSEHYRPFSLKELTLSSENDYFVKNHLKEVLHDLIESQQAETLELVNHNFASPNLLKSQMRAKFLALEDFKEATLLQVDGLFNPSQLPAQFTLKENTTNPMLESDFSIIENR